MPDAPLRATLGDWGIDARAARARRGHARGRARTAKRVSYGEENTFARDVTARDRLVEAIAAHAEAVARRLRRDRVRARRITLKLKLAQPLGAGRYPLLTRSLTRPTPTDDGQTIATAAKLLLERANPTIAIRLLGVSASRLEPAATAQMNLDPDTLRRTRLNQAIDQIHTRHGESALHRGPTSTNRPALSSSLKRGED